MKINLESFISTPTGLSWRFWTNQQSSREIFSRDVKYLALFKREWRECPASQVYDYQLEFAKIKSYLLEKYDPDKNPGGLSKKFPQIYEALQIKTSILGATGSQQALLVASNARMVELPFWIILAADVQAHRAKGDARRAQEMEAQEAQQQAQRAEMEAQLAAARAEAQARTAEEQALAQENDRIRAQIAALQLAQLHLLSCQSN